MSYPLGMTDVGLDPLIREEATHYVLPLVGREVDQLCIDYAVTLGVEGTDVMASYTVLLRADKALYPVLLSNGNLVEQGDLDGGRHFAKWVDPHKKPSYLFALVAGKLVARQQRITSRAGNEQRVQSRHARPLRKIAAAY